MKKLFFFAAVALTFAACTKTTIDESAAPDVPVTFQAANYTPATKAGGEVSVFGDFKNFQCLAYLHAVGVDLNADGTLKDATNPTYQDFFGTGETISPYDNTNAVIANPTKETNNVSYWAPSHNYYWPKDSKSYVNFVAWYGTDGTNPVNPSVTYKYVSSKWKATMTWNFSSTVGSAGANLLYADMAWRYNQTPAAQYGLNGLSTGTNKGVPMLFHHALAQINVKAYALAAEATPANPTINAGVTDGTATWTIKLKDVKITPVIKDGTLALTNEDPGTNKTQAWSGSWAGSSAAGAMVRSEDFTVDKVSKETAGDLIAATCVVPQTIGEGVVLSFDLDITTAYAGNVSHHEIIPISIKLNDMGTTAWNMNTKYTYFLQINPSQKTVLFDPAVEADWVEGTTTEKTI